jgi:magnesium transporter
VGSFFPILADFDDRIDELENAIFLRACEEQLQEIFQKERLLVGMRKAVSPQRDAFAAVAGGIAARPGLAQEDEHDLPAAQLADRLLRPELHLARGSDR